MTLNTEQQEAATYLDGPALILAGPGTGKTTTLVGHYRHILESGVDPKEIICSTFNAKAAQELKDRISQQTDLNLRPLPIGTFHSIALRVLRAIGANVKIKPDFEIWAKDWERITAVRTLQKDAIDEGVYKDVSKTDTSPEKALAFIDSVREKLIDPEDAAILASEIGNDADAAHADVYARYEKYLDQENKIDFPRMVQWACKSLAKDDENGGAYAKQFTHVLVDEFQDINFAQKTFVDLLLKGGASIWAVGDDDQAIYGWRGSDIRFILDFKKDHPNAKIINLVENYRAGYRLIAASNKLVSCLMERHDKTITATRTERGELVVEMLNDEHDEAYAVVEEIQARLEKGIKLNEIAVLGRTNKLPMKVVDRLIKYNIPAVLRGGVSVFQEYEAKLLLNSLALTSGATLPKKWSIRVQKDLYGFSQKLKEENTTWDKSVKALATFIIKRPPPGISDDEIEERTDMLNDYREYLLEFEELEILCARLKLISENQEDKDGIFVGTIHSAKGLEWDSVFVLGWEDEVMPQTIDTRPKILEEERRIAYVAVTRAKNFLMLTHVDERYKRERETSEFLAELLGVFDNELISDFNSSDVPARPITEPPKQAPVPRPEPEDKQSPQPIFEENREDKMRRLREERLDEERRTLNREMRERKERKAQEKEREDQKIADGSGGEGSGWSDQAAGTGLLAEAGYTVQKGGPGGSKRSKILRAVLQGGVHLPAWFSQSVQDQWSAPNSEERLQKIRNTINVALGNQKGRAQPSMQAIDKWEADLGFIDNVLRPQLLEEIKGSVS
jgi:DNA helicase-2/ATP-dependent DNA helicase PcrA